jgi:hypothetical protein
MNKIVLILKYFVLATVCTLITSGNCQTFSGTVNKPVTIEFTAKPSGFNEIPCSIEITLPNNEKKILVSNAPEYKIKYDYVPKNEGTFELNWEGMGSLDGKRAEFIEAGVKQLFGNLGQALQGRKLSQSITACNGEGKFFLSVQQSLKNEQVSSGTPNDSNKKSSYTGEYKATAEAPKSVNNPIESESFKHKYTSDPNYKLMVDGFNNERSKQSLTLLRSYSEQGDANAQFLFGLAHLEDWTGLYDLRKACYWIRQSAVSGLSQARLVLANRAFNRRECFDVTPTLEEAKIWAQLASMSSDKIVKENADKLLGDILKAQISGQK